MGNGSGQVFIMALKCSSHADNVEGAIVLDFKVFFSCAVVRVTGMTANNPLGGTCPGGGMVIPLGERQSSSTGTGSLTSQSSSSIRRGRPVSRETTLYSQVSTQTPRFTIDQTTYLSQL